MNKRDKKDIENEEQKNRESQCSCNNDCSCEDGDCDCETVNVEEILIQLDNKTKKCEELIDMFQRAAAEFDNYKKRTLKEKDALYSDAVSDVISAFLPVIDNLERALCSAECENSNEKSLRNGIELVIRQVQDVLKCLDVKVIKGIGEQFDPQLHNAVMHIEDESLGQNIIAEEFQKGYVYKEKVIRHSMVKVAN